MKTLLLILTLALCGCDLKFDFGAKFKSGPPPVDPSKSHNIKFPKPKKRTVGDLAVGETATTWVRFDYDTGQPFVSGTMPINESWQRDVITRYAIGTYLVRLDGNNYLRYGERPSSSTNVLIEQEPVEK